jgi:hypothetical protein
MAGHTTPCGHCGPVTVNLTVDTLPILVDILTSLARIEHALTRERHLMSEIDDRLAAYATKFDEFTTDLSRELADLTNAIGGNLSDGQRAQFDALVEKLAAAKLAIDTADPPPAG